VTSRHCHGFADLVVAGVDREGGRFVLNEFCAAYNRPYIDVATGVLVDSGAYSGRVVYAFDRPTVPAACTG
jgi:hypothetical protein